MGYLFNFQSFQSFRSFRTVLIFLTLCGAWEPVKLRAVEVIELASKTAESATQVCTPENLQAFAWFATRFPGVTTATGGGATVLAGGSFHLASISSAALTRLGELAYNAFTQVDGIAKEAEEFTWLGRSFSNNTIDLGSALIDFGLDVQFRTFLMTHPFGMYHGHGFCDSCHPGVF